MPPRRVRRPHTSSSILSPCPHTTYPPLPAVAPVEEAIPEEKRQRYTRASMPTPNAIACTAGVLAARAATGRCPRPYQGGKMWQGTSSSLVQPHPEERPARRSATRSSTKRLPTTGASKVGQQQADLASSTTETIPSKGKEDGGEGEGWG